MRSRDTPDDENPDVPESPLREGRWLVALPQTPDARDAGVSGPWWDGWRHRLPGRVWAALAAIVAALIGVVVAVSATYTGPTGDVVRATAAPPSATSAAEEACTGLSGTLVTDRDGDPTTVAGLIASFEAAYYVHRNAEAAMRLLAPESGIAAEGLAAGIASIPAGTTHCVSITPISASTAEVQVSEVRPDGQRIDYLQVVNTRPGEAGALLISNIQGRR